MIKLYDYWRSSAAYRLRIAMNLKGLAYEAQLVDIKPGNDDQRSATYAALNPQMRVPSIEYGGQVSGQSMAILEWLEETQKGPSLLPTDPWMRLRCRAFADIIACDVHPLNNLSVLASLRNDMGADDTAIKRWYHDWIDRGFAALETLAADLPDGEYLFGSAPSFAEIALVPQIYNARRFEMDLEAYPRLLQAEARCHELEAFARAAPDAQA